jgi:hypothetical protein
MNGRLTCVRSGLFLGGLIVCGLGLGDTAQAGSQSSSKGKSGGHSAVAMLQAAKHHLQHADHDYKGHRVKALHEVNQAIHHLSGHHKSSMSSAAANGTKTGKGQSPKEPQAQSDHHLKQALHELQSAEKAMSHGSSKGSKSGNHHSAAMAIHTAIQELHTALKIK